MSLEKNHSRFYTNSHSYKLNDIITLYSNNNNIKKIIFLNLNCDNIDIKYGII
jgi:hypothetical protein